MTSTLCPRNEHASLVGLLVQLRRVGACSNADRHRGDSAGGQCSASEADDLKAQGTLVGLAAAAVSVLRRGSVPASSHCRASTEQMSQQATAQSDQRYPARTQTPSAIHHSVAARLVHMLVEPASPAQLHESSPRAVCRRVGTDLVHEGNHLVVDERAHLGAEGAVRVGVVRRLEGVVPERGTKRTSRLAAAIDLAAAAAEKSGRDSIRHRCAALCRPPL